MSLAAPTRIPATVGPQIWADFHAAGLDGVPVSVTPDAVEVDASVSADTLAKVRAVVAAYDPNKPAPVIVPQQVPMWAAQAALKQAGKYDAINGAIVPAMETSNPPVFFAWTMGNFASRQSAFIATLASQFDMKAADIDAVFVAADKIAQTAG